MTHSPQTIPLPDAIFWDWDGTIVDSYDFLNDVYNYVLVALGLAPLKVGEFRQYFGKVPKDQLFDTLFGNDKEKAFDLYLEYSLKNNYLIRSFDGLIGTLERVTEYCIKTGIVTIKKRELVQREASNNDLASFFPIIVGVGDAKKDKPSPEPIWEAIRKSGLGVNKHNIWYVGDTGADALCAQRARVSFVLKKGHIDTPQIIKEYDPLFSFDHYDELTNFLTDIHTIKR